jgi:hypothetical protein
MIVLDTLSGTDDEVWKRWERLPTAHQIEQDDAKIIRVVRSAWRADQHTPTRI